ncbi:MAG: hypothetical protein Q9225_007183 [Loekoesia sp. 1 TL-2023]
MGALVTHNFYVKKEIRLRSNSALLSQKIFESTRDIARLEDAIQHIQAIVRLLTTPSARRAHYLDKLALLDMSAFKATNSMKTLDDSIAHSKQARGETLPMNNLQIVKTYHNLGYSLSHRAEATKNVQDLDEAIYCCRQILLLTKSSSAAYFTTMLNLANYLQRRYIMHHQPADIDEATSLLDPLIKNIRWGSKQHGPALLLKASILYVRFHDTKNIQDVEDAITTCHQGLAIVPENHKFRPEMLPYLPDMYYIKYKHNRDLESLNTALHYGKKAVQDVPKSYPTRVDRVANYLSILADFVFACNTIDRTREAIQEARPLLDEVPKKHAKRHSCNLSFGLILSKQYLLSHKIEDVSRVVDHVYSTVDEYNEELDSTHSKVPSTLFHRLAICLHEIKSAAPRNLVRAQASERVYQCYVPAHKSKNVHRTILSMEKKHGKEFQIFARNLGSDQKLSKGYIRYQVQQLQREEAKGIAKRQDATIRKGKS